METKLNATKVERMKHKCNVLMSSEANVNIALRSICILIAFRRKFCGNGKRCAATEKLPKKKTKTLI